MGEPEQSTKDVMSQIVGIVEEVAQVVEAITREAKGEREEPSKVDLSFLELSEVTLTEAKIEKDLGKIIACVPDPDFKVEKT